ncbi:MAG: rRNA ((2552)-2-O)-methyltransferase [Gammaproteobacteria bacterium]|jgi:23S rRNA (uridine2552-2'-O)-methyltransferase|nr:rRNA ((2552)-2-O)-methyltransferase [Gammaproteobacteria bacterium]
MKRTNSSARWLREHFNDDYVKRAQKEGYRSRAAYKLLELQERDKLIKPGMAIVDLGASPGGWSIAAYKSLKGQGKIFALDLLPMDALEGVVFIQGDFNEDSVLVELMAQIDNRPIDLVMSDMAPNMSGTKEIDQPKAMALTEQALDFAKQVLKPNGSFLVKAFHGEGFDAFLKDMRSSFTSVKIRKPKASRPRSNEVYLVGQGFR